MTMTVAALLERITNVYPGATAEAMRGVRSAYFAMLRKHEGDVLAEAVDAVVGSFRATTRQPFPIAADFLAHLPSSTLKLPSSGPRIDFDARRRRVASVMARWRGEQGEPLSRGVPEILASLEFIALPIAGLRGYSDDPEPIVLSADQVRIAQHRALSQERRRLYGDVRSNAAHWEQIETLAAQWGIDTRIEDWASKERVREPSNEGGKSYKAPERQPISPTADQLRVKAWREQQARAAEVHDVHIGHEPPPHDAVPEVA